MKILQKNYTHFLLVLGTLIFFLHGNFIEASEADANEKYAQSNSGFVKAKEIMKNYPGAFIGGAIAVASTLATGGGYLAYGKNRPSKPNNPDENQQEESSNHKPDNTNRNHIKMTDGKSDNQAPPPLDAEALKIQFENLLNLDIGIGQVNSDIQKTLSAYLKKAQEENKSENKQHKATIPMLICALKNYIDTGNPNLVWYFIGKDKLELAEPIDFDYKIEKKMIGGEEEYELVRNDSANGVIIARGGVKKINIYEYISKEKEILPRAMLEVLRYLTGMHSEQLFYDIIIKLNIKGYNLYTDIKDTLAINSDRERVYQLKKMIRMHRMLFSFRTGTKTDIVLDKILREEDENGLKTIVLGFVLKEAIGKEKKYEQSDEEFIELVRELFSSDLDLTKRFLALEPKHPLKMACPELTAVNLLAYVFANPRLAAIFLTQTSIDNLYDSAIKGIPEELNYRKEKGFQDIKLINHLLKGKLGVKPDDIQDKQFEEQLEQRLGEIQEGIAQLSEEDELYNQYIEELRTILIYAIGCAKDTQGGGLIKKLSTYQELKNHFKGKILNFTNLLTSSKNENLVSIYEYISELIEGNNHQTNKVKEFFTALGLKESETNAYLYQGVAMSLREGTLLPDQGPDQIIEKLVTEKLNNSDTLTISELAIYFAKALERASIGENTLLTLFENNKDASHMVYDQLLKIQAEFHPITLIDGSEINMYEYIDDLLWAAENKNDSNKFSVLVKKFLKNLITEENKALNLQGITPEELATNELQGLMEPIVIRQFQRGGKILGKKPFKSKYHKDKIPVIEAYIKAKVAKIGSSLKNNQKLAGSEVRGFLNYAFKLAVEGLDKDWKLLNYLQKKGLDNSLFLPSLGMMEESDSKDGTLYGYLNEKMKQKGIPLVRAFAGTPKTIREAIPVKLKSLSGYSKGEIKALLESSAVRYQFAEEVLLHEKDFIKPDKKVIDYVEAKIYRLQKEENTFSLEEKEKLFGFAFLYYLLAVKRGNYLQNKFLLELFKKKEGSKTTGLWVSKEVVTNKTPVVGKWGDIELTTDIYSVAKIEFIRLKKQRARYDNFIQYIAEFFDQVGEKKNVMKWIYPDYEYKVGIENVDPRTKESGRKKIWTKNRPISSLYEKNVETIKKLTNQLIFFDKKIKEALQKGKIKEVKDQLDELLYELSLPKPTNSKLVVQKLSLDGYRLTEEGKRKLIKKEDTFTRVEALLNAKTILVYNKKTHDYDLDYLDHYLEAKCPYEKSIQEAIKKMREHPLYDKTQRKAQSN